MKGLDGELIMSNFTNEALHQLSRAHSTWECKNMKGKIVEIPGTAEIIFLNKFGFPDTFFGGYFNLFFTFF